MKIYQEIIMIDINIFFQILIFQKILEIPENYNGKFNFNSYGYNKNYDTNIK